jgi:hypothetical protein
MEPESINQWFPINKQDKYISRLLEEKVARTSHQAKCYVRLWAYLLVKQRQKLKQEVKLPLTELSRPEGFVSCTHREAVALFYCDQEQGKGSDRSAGMMIDTLRDLGLIKKKFDGNSLSLQILYQPNLKSSPQPAELVELRVDAFNHNDAVFVAEFLSRLYVWINSDTAAVKLKIINSLRRWVKEYPTGMRVLRRCDNSNPVGFYVLYPTAAESEKNFFLPPSRILHLSSDSQTDPFKIALLCDSECRAVFVRSWRIDTPYKNRDNVCRFLKDTQETLELMLTDFPNLCDFYLMSLHPIYSDEKLALALGFERIGGDLMSPNSWLYKPVSQFLALDIEDAISTLDFDILSPKF